MKETKNKYAIYLYPSLVEEVDTLMKDANTTSRREFISDALRFYVGYLKQGKNVDYLAPIIAQTIKEEIRSTEKNISQILFKLAVESAMISEIQATQINLTPSRWRISDGCVPGLLPKIMASSPSKVPMSFSIVKEKIHA